MTSLKDLSIIYADCPMKAILEYCSQDEVVADVPKLLTDLMQRKIDKKIRYENWVKTWLYYPSQYYQFFDYDTAHKLDSLTRRMQLSYPFDKEDIEFMKNLQLPNEGKGIPFWNDLYQMFKYFKGELEEKPKLSGYYEIDFTISKEQQ